MSLYVIPITKPRRAWGRRDMERILQQIRQLPVDAGRAITLTIRCSGRGGRAVRKETLQLLVQVRKDALLPRVRGDIPIRSEVRLQKPRKTG